MPIRTSAAIALFLGSTVLGCSSGSSAGAPDASTAAPSGDGSAAATPGTTDGTCTPSPGFAGNSKNVGAYCTKNGGQCSAYGSATLECSIDLSSMGSNFCIVLGCSQDSDCGEDACCTGETGNPVKACVPKGCFDGGFCQAISQ